MLLFLLFIALISFDVILALIAVLALLGTGILLIVRFIQYLVKIKIAANSTPNPELMQFFNWQIAAFFMSVIQIIAVLISPDISVNPFSFQSIIGYLGSIFSLLSYLKLKKWGAMIIGSNSYDYSASSLISGINLIISGMIISIIPYIGVIGLIVHYIGLGK